MFRSVLGDLHTKVGGVHDILSYAVDFVSKDQGIARPGFAPHILERAGVFRLLGADHGPAFRLQFPHEAERIVAMLPGNAVLRAQGGFVDLGRWRNGADTAQIDLVHLEGVTAAESRPDIVGATDIIQYEHHPRRGQCPIRFRPDSAQFNISQLAVAHPRRYLQRGTPAVIW